MKGRVDTIVGFDPGAGGDTLPLSSSYWQSNGAIFGVGTGVISATLADIRSLVGTSGCSFSYATNTRQLMFDADGNCREGGSGEFDVVLPEGIAIAHRKLANASGSLGDAKDGGGLDVWNRR